MQTCDLNLAAIKSPQAADFLLFDFYVDFPSMEKLNFKSGQDGRRKGVFQRADLFDKNVA